MEELSKIAGVDYKEYGFNMLKAGSSLRGKSKEEVLYTDYILCLYNGISAIDGKTLDVLKNEQLLKRLGFNLPFMVDMSIQLIDYGMINKIYLNNELMVNKLWK